MFYDFHNNMAECMSQPENEYFAIIPIENANDYQITQYYSDEIHTLLMRARFSKIEIFSNYIYGTLNIPEILMGDNTGFTFIYTPHYLIFIDKNEYIKQCFEKILETHKNNLTSPGAALYYILDYLIYNDLEKMSTLQQKLANLEQDILRNRTRRPNLDIANYRNSTMKLYHYYIQLAGICGNLTESTLDFFDEETKELFSILQKKVSLLSQEAQQIWEYTSQLRDIYQQQLEVHQNSIMKVLTIVTTIFMPLTLLTGWYGMNFSYIPGLKWRYGYLSLFVFCVIIVIVLCLVFKKKKWW